MPETNLPAWALNHLKENLPADAVLLNAAVHRRGVVVANTRIGAVVVTKRWFGEPRHELLANPRERVNFQCVVCQEQLEFRRLDLPALVHCGICGSKYAIDTSGLPEIKDRLSWTPGLATLPATGERTAPASPTAAGPFMFNGFTLHGRMVELKNGGSRTIYFFAKSKPRSGAPCAKPAGYHVGVNEKTGLPFLKKGTAPDGEDLTPEAEHHYRPQCAALTSDGHQCRNSARHESKYCASHFGYQPPAIAKAAAQREDTLPRVKAAPDTLPSVRRKATP
ncbi:MAG: hypothetical protein V4510_00800 [bacterium]